MDLSSGIVEFNVVEGGFYFFYSDMYADHTEFGLYEGNGSVVKTYDYSSDDRCLTDKKVFSPYYCFGYELVVSADGVDYYFFSERDKEDDHLVHHFVRTGYLKDKEEGNISGSVNITGILNELP
jgi:hypothetical protein